MAQLLALSLFAAGYFAITLEHRIFVNKAAASLLLAVGLWVITSVVLPGEAGHFLYESSADIFGIVVFLLTAMTLVEVLVHYGFFSAVENSLRRHRFTSYQMGWVIAMVTFGLSAFLDNLTTAIVMIQIAMRLFPKEERLAVGALIVIVANAGGAFSPLGDVTTVMLWFAHKFSALQVIAYGFFPSVVLALISSWLVLRHTRDCQLVPAEKAESLKMSRSDRAIVGVTLGAFILPLGASALNLPPYLGLLAGLGVVWMLIDLAKHARPQASHLGAHIKHFLQQTDMESIQFFVGILLAVAALHALGILDSLTAVLLGQDPSVFRLAAAFSGLGIGSALVDNVPLTAAAVSAIDGVVAPFWVLLALTVGTGGSLLVIGSAAGVVAMGMLPKLTFGKYLQVATLPALAGFAAAIGVWWVQFMIFR